MIWAVVIVALGYLFVFALLQVGSGDPLPPERPMWTVTPYRDEADVVCEGCGADVAMTLLDMVRRDHADERRVRVVYMGKRYEVRRPLWGRVTVRAISG